MLVICPAFVSDCLETIEEIGMRARESFIAEGGSEFALIPCLNEHPLWLDTLERMTNTFLYPHAEGRKAPSSKLQAPEKFQTSSSKP